MPRWPPSSQEDAPPQKDRYDSILDGKKTCPRCREHWVEPRYIGRLFHDFRRSAAHELRKSGNSIDECKASTGHETDAMFKRYADLFTDEERKQRQQAAHERREAWKRAEAERRKSPSVTAFIS